MDTASSAAVGPLADLRLRRESVPARFGVAASREAATSGHGRPRSGVAVGGAASEVGAPPGWPPTGSGSGFLWSVGVSMVAAVAVIALSLEADAAGAGEVVAFLASSLCCAALPIALRRPVVAVAMQCVGTVVLGLSTLDGPIRAIPFTPVAGTVLIAHVALTALNHDWRVAAGFWWTIAGIGVLIAAIDDSAVDRDEVPALAVLVALSLVALLVGFVLRQRARIREELTAARRDVAEEQARRMLVEERTRIARELHDVVAHSMSVIHMQATSAPFRFRHIDAAHAEFRSIADGAREALGEMRQVLGVLRETDTAPDPDRAEPAPGLASLAGLIETTTRSGTPVTLDVDPGPGPVPPTVGTTVYRIVQEALGNVVRHAPGASATIRVLRVGDRLVVTVANGPEGRRSPIVEIGAARARHGIRGMRERAEHLGGDLVHGPDGSGGFRVRARLPLPVITQPGAER